MGTQLSSIMRNTLRPGYFRVMSDKLLARLEKDERTEARAWATARAVKPSDLCQPLDSVLWSEALQWASEFRPRSEQELREAGASMGGGAAIELLYFLTRYLGATTVVETGVAAGWSSTAILAALERNGDGGTLYSSDLPYFRLRNPHEHIGVLVPQALRERWHLFTDGDRRNLRRIIRQVDGIELFSYDSDKSRRGRRLAMESAVPLLAPEGVIVMDDIQDNLFFRDYASMQSRPFAVLSQGNKFVGLIGLA